MFSRHVPTRRLKSGVFFSAPDDLIRVPHDDLTQRPKRRRLNNIRNVATGIGRRLVDEEMAFDSSPAPDQQQSIAMFAKIVDTSSYGSSTRPKNSDMSKQEKEISCLPVLRVSLTATVEGTLAHMTLKQSFQNPSKMTIREARHTFPLYDGSVVTAFECTIGDERRLRGVVKPREQARKEYKEAIRDQSKAAALLEEHTPDIFETSLGNIPPMTTVEVKIVYIQELKVVMMEGEVSEGIGLIIPTSIAPRYNDPKSTGELPPELPQDKLDIEIHILNDGDINPEGCLEESGHPVDYHGTKMMESPQRLNGEHPVNEYYFWDHHSELPVLKKDFVLVVPMQKGHEMESRAIMSPPDESGLAAMMVSIRPNELFRNAIIPQSFSGEILFLLDQSASMDDLAGNNEVASDGSFFGFTRGVNRSGPTKIDVLREAMHLVLAGLPQTCSFNIISWGSKPMGMWEQSRQHTPDNLMEAKEFVSEIKADMGGTDLLRALERTVERRLDGSRSTQIVVLTDGELDPEEPMEFIWRTRQELQNRIRFFALGIGDDVPRRLIESIAELGGGFGDVVDTNQNPRWHASLNRLTKSALEPDTWDCEIDIGDEFQQRSLIDYKLNDSISIAQRVPYFQAPPAIAGLHPFRFNSIYFLIDIKSSEVLPSEVTITTTTHRAKKKIYKLPVKPTTIHDETMHQLAAKAVVVDLEERVKRGPSSSQPSNLWLAEENAQIIGTKYSITSKWTSFVAVPHDEPTNNKGNLMEHYKALIDEVDISELINAKSEDDSEPDHDMLTNNHHEVHVAKPGYFDNSPALVTAPPLSVGDPNFGGWVKPKNISFNRARHHHRILTAHQNRDNIQMGAPSTAYDARLGQPSTPIAAIWTPSYELDREKTMNETFYTERPKLQVQSPGYGDHQPPFIEVSQWYTGEAIAVTDKSKPTDEDHVKEAERCLYPYSSADLPGEVYSGPSITTEKEPAKERPSDPEVDASLRYPMLYDQGCDMTGEFEFLRAKDLPMPKPEKEDGIHEYLYNYADYVATLELVGEVPSYEDFAEQFAPQILTSSDSPASVRSREVSVTPPLQNTSRTMDPLNWKTAVKYQNGQGLFELSEEARNILHLHFCPNTRFVLALKLSKVLHDQGLDRHLCIQIIDTMIMVKCYQTHLALTEDIWDLMMERAQDAMAEAVGQETLELLDGILTDSMMHQHYKAATGEGEEHGGLTGMTTCPVCDIRWQPSRAFFCPLEHKPGTTHAFEEWFGFWKHQQEFGHIVCPREGTSD